MAKVDTVGNKYYKPLEWMDWICGKLFWINSALSVAVIMVDKAVYPVENEALQVFFLTSALLFFVLSEAVNIYLFPRAENARRQQGLSDSFGVTLTHEETLGYYNNDQTKPLRRMAANAMESVFFTKANVSKMLHSQRGITLGYVLIWLGAMAYRPTNLELLGLAAQVLFSGEIIGRWARMEWLRSRCEKLFEDFNKLFTSGQSTWKPVAQAQAIDLFTGYETTKSTAAILLSTKLFHKNNRAWTAEWEQIRRRLGI